MKTHVLATAILAGTLMSAQVAHADGYLRDFGDRASEGFFNTTLGFFEVPKNVVNISSDENIVVGLTWGLVRGAFEGVSRTVVGVAELVTSPFPVDALATPEYPWSRFSEDSRYFGLHFPGYWTTYGPLDDGHGSH
jgi:putative exosortase-associated protein (TIGR04073 family)